MAKLAAQHERCRRVCFKVQERRHSDDREFLLPAESPYRGSKSRALAKRTRRGIRCVTSRIADIHRSTRGEVIEEGDAPSMAHLCPRSTTLTRSSLRSGTEASLLSQAHGNQVFGPCIGSFVCIRVRRCARSQSNVLRTLGVEAPPSQHCAFSRMYLGLLLGTQQLATPRALDLEASLPWLGGFGHTRFCHLLCKAVSLLQQLLRPEICFTWLGGFVHMDLLAWFVRMCEKCSSAGLVV